MVVKNVDKLKELYEIDDYLWIEETVKLLKGKRFEELDLDNLIEELEDLGSEKRHKVESLLEQIIRHLLLLEYWHNEYERNYRHWQAEIVGFRNQLSDRMTTNFYNYLEENLPKIYRKAHKYVQVKSGLDTFPQDCPYSLQQLLDEDWLPSK
ncbi:DUF29 domain-containing protein [Crocosphaera chwakensis]|uniref:DUF29 domain-containing protein n=1 Tax=Crocosphaera chwakensis CCY0110 TaxID=391612 RepID=A3ILE9_9CHRO|nr:DUF29 domain-containing protein [Crocosphaera chwakensis]EAZ92600.1 hypothetical protein CY0110_23576 [Crocosphaera chwakensis CCY0110]